MLATTEMRRRKTTFAFIIGVVALISYLVLMIDGLAEGLRGEYGSAVQALDADAIAFAADADTSIFRSELDERTAAAVEQVPGVHQSGRLTYLPADYRTASDTLNSAGFLGFDPGSIGEPDVARGRTIRTGESGALLADPGLLRQSGLELGDTITLSSRGQHRDFEIVGEMSAQALGFLPVGYVANEDLLDLKYGEDRPGRPTASVVLLQGDDLAGLHGPSFDLVSKDEAFDHIEGLSDANATMGAIRVIVYAIGAAVVGVFFYILTLHKTAVIAMLKALGAANRFVLAQLTAQAILVVALGLTVAIPAAKASSDALTRFAPDAIPVQPTLEAYVLTSLAILVTALIGVAFSIRGVVRIDPILALARQQ